MAAHLPYFSFAIAFWIVWLDALKVPFKTKELGAPDGRDLR
jgi:hypothetical protein